MTIPIALAISAFLCFLVFWWAFNKNQEADELEDQLRYGKVGYFSFYTGLAFLVINVWTQIF